jgi:tetratricopeptide (TPR) repeat protein
MPRDGWVKNHTIHILNETLTLYQKDCYKIKISPLVINGVFSIMKFHQKIQHFCYTNAAKVFLNWSATQIQRNELRKAIQNASRALHLDPTLTTAYIQRGRAHYRLGEFAAAMRDYNAALERNPKWADVYINRGLVFYATGCIEEAVGDFNWAIHLNPRQPIAYNHRGLADEALGNLTGAIADYTQAIQLDPRLALVYTNRGRARMSKGDITGALKDFQQYLSLGGGWLHGDQHEVEALVQRLTAASM